MTELALTNMTMPDGARCFFVPELSLDPYQLRRLIGNVSGVKLLGTIDCDEVERCWFNFEYLDLRFSVHNPFPNSTFWFIANDPLTSDDVLTDFLGDFLSLIDD